MLIDAKIIALKQSSHDIFDLQFSGTIESLKKILLLMKGCKIFIQINIGNLKNIIHFNIHPWNSAEFLLTGTDIKHKKNNYDKNFINVIEKIIFVIEKYKNDPYLQLLIKGNNNDK